MIAGLSAASATFIGHGVNGSGGFGSPTSVERYLAHGFSQGVMAELRGDRFGDGVLAGVVGHASGALSGSLSKGLNVNQTALISGFVGGVAAEATGGDFVLGAVQSATVYLYNESLEHGAQKGDPDIGGFSPGPGDYVTDGGGVVSLSVNDYGGLHDGGNNFYALNTDGTVSMLASGAIDGVYPETLIGGGRLVVAAGYKAISFVTGRSAPTFANFARGSNARNAWKVMTGGKAFRLRAKPPSFYWNRAGGDFSRAVQSLGHSNTVWNQRMIPLLPLGAAGDSLD